MKKVDFLNIFQVPNGKIVKQNAHAQLLKRNKNRKQTSETETIVGSFLLLFCFVLKWNRRLNNDVSEEKDEKYYTEKLKELVIWINFVILYCIGHQ